MQEREGGKEGGREAKTKSHMLTCNSLDNGKHHLEEVGQQVLGVQGEAEVEGLGGGEALQEVEAGAKRESSWLLQPLKLAHKQ